MAQYQRIYTFTGQGNTSAVRTVAWSKFAVSGDTTHNVGQIVGITYEHWHSSTGTPTRTLRGRLVLSDGNVIVSSEDSHHFQKNVIKFTNAFSQLPTAEQFAQIIQIETINESSSAAQAGYSDSQKLYWRANSANPMRVIVDFLEEPPTNYAPKVDKFVVGRCDGAGVMVDDGLYIKTTLKLSIGDSAGLSDGASLKVYYAADAQPTTESPYVDLTSRIAEFLTGVTFDASVLPNQWAAGSSWYFAVVFTTGAEVASGADSVGNAYAPIFISKDGKHVSIGGFPKVSSEESTLEVYSKLYLYAGSSLDSLGIQSGTASFPQTAANAYADITVTFPKEYVEIPIVIVGFKSGATAGYFGRCTCSVVTSTTTGCTIRFFNGDSSARTPSCNWIAVGTV